MADSNLQGLRTHNEALNKQVTEYLQQALILLLEKKEFGEISITELCKKAGVSRMAFYGNYQSKEDLFEQIVRSLNKDLVEAVGSPFSRTTGLSWYQNFFDIMAENIETIRTVIGADRARYRKAINYVVLSSSQLTEEQKYMRIIWTGGMIDATLFWIDSNLNISAEEIASLCYRSLDSLITGYPNN